MTLKEVSINNDPALSFLQGGGEMGELTRNYDWEKTVLGKPESWPQSLRTTLSIILNSGFPMFLFWGEELTCFYNNAYRPSLGNNGKHPYALGKPAVEIWPEIWDDIKPLIDQVLGGGESTWSEDQLLPIYRNGQIEDVYWTFSYSPVNDESGKPAGVFITCTETTRQIKTLQKFKQSDLRFQNLVREAAVGIVVLKGAGYVVDLVNEAYGVLVGKTPQELMGNELFNILPEVENPFRALLDKVRLTGESVYLYEQHYFVFVEGEKKEGYLNVVYQPYREIDGAVTGVIALCHDVTDQVNFTKKIAESEKNLKNIFSQAPVAMSLVMGKDHIVEIANGRTLAMWGRTAEEIIGKPVFEVISEAKGKGFEELLNAVYATGRPYKGTNVPVSLLRNGKMEDMFVSFVYEPYRDLDGNVAGVMSISTDVTEEEIARRKLQESEQKVRAIVESAPFPIGVYVGKEMRIQVANQTMMDAWGKGNDVIGKVYSEILPELNNQDIFDQLDAVYSTGIAFHAKNQRVDIVKEGLLQSFYFNYSFTPLYDNEGNVYGVMNTAADVTDLNLAKEKIEENKLLLQWRVEERTREISKANEELAEMNRELEQFSYAASHDMQEPLRKIQTFTSFLLDNPEGLDEKKRSLLGKIDASVQRMRTIIEDLLNYSHQTRSSQDFEKVDMDKLISQVESDLDYEIQQKNAIIEKDKLPVMMGVKTQLNQLFFNLFSNALKFSREGVPLRIQVRYSKAPADLLQEKGLNHTSTYAYFRVTDNGIGFHQEYAEQIFGLFKRLHGRNEYKGTGIGLGLAKKVVQNHHGIIWATSRPLEGATFSILLPE